MQLLEALGAKLCKEFADLVHYMINYLSSCCCELALNMLDAKPVVMQLLVMLGSGCVKNLLT